MLQASPVAIAARDGDGRGVSWNAAAEQIFGWPQEEVRGTPIPYLPPGAEAEGEDIRRRSLDGETVSGVEVVRLRKDGRPVEVSMSAALVRDITGRPTTYLTMIAD